MKPAADKCVLVTKPRVLVTKPHVAMRVTRTCVTRTVRKNRMKTAVFAACMQSLGDFVDDHVTSSAFHGVAAYLTILIGML